MKDLEAKSFVILLARGALGGVAGGCVFAAVEVCLLRPNGWDNWVGYFLLLFIAYGLPFGLFMGLLLGIVMWSVPDRSGKASGLLTRAIFGTLLGSIASGIVLFANSSGQEGYVPTPWIRHVIGVILLGAAFGGIPAIIIGKRTHS